MRSAFSAALGLALLAACGRGAEPGATRTVGAGDPPPHVLLISLDTMRADRLSAYGELEGRARPLTPLLDRLAAESALFTDCVAASTITGPSHLTLFTGQLPTRHGLVGNGGVVRPRATLASALADAGWATAGFTGGGYLRESYGLAHGFETYRAKGGPLAAFKRTFATSIPYALEWLEAASDEPAFLFLHGYDPHCPYEASADAIERVAGPRAAAAAPFDPTGKCGEKHYLADLESGSFDEADRAHLANLYDALVHEADASLEPFLRALRRSGWLDRSILVFTSDHGESLGEHGWIGHGRLWEEQARVPLFIRFPGGAHAGRYDAPVSLADVLPTLLDALDLPALPGVQGASLMPLLERGEALPDRPRVTVFEDEVAVRFAGEAGEHWKLVLGADEPALYDLAADPDELADLAGAGAAGRADRDVAAEARDVDRGHLAQPRSEHDAETEGREGDGHPGGPTGQPGGRGRAVQRSVPQAPGQRDAQEDREEHGGGAREPRDAGDEVAGGELGHRCRERETRHEHDQARERDDAIVERQHEAPDEERAERGDERRDRLVEAGLGPAAGNEAREQEQHRPQRAGEGDLVRAAAEETGGAAGDEREGEGLPRRAPAGRSGGHDLQAIVGLVDARAPVLDVLHQLVQRDQLAEVHVAGLHELEVHDLVREAPERREHGCRRVEEGRFDAEAVRELQHDPLEPVRGRSVPVEQLGEADQERARAIEVARGRVRTSRGGGEGGGHGAALGARRSG